jgi:hypothetical protein
MFDVFSALHQSDIPCSKAERLFRGISKALLGVLYVLKKTLNCQLGVIKLRVVEKYMPKVKRLVGV